MRNSAFNKSENLGRMPPFGELCEWPLALASHPAKAELTATLNSSTVIAIRASRMYMPYSTQNTRFRCRPSI